MTNNQFNDRRPSELEEQANKEARRHFSEHLKQFAASLTSVRQLERNLVTVAADAITHAATQSPQPGNAFHNDDGTRWHHSMQLWENIHLCHRSTTNGPEFAVIEQRRMERGATEEILTRGRNALEVLRAFVRDQKQALDIWTEDVSAQVREYLAEKYAGHDMSRVADGFMHRFTHTLSLKEALSETNSQKHGHGFRV